MEEYKKRPGDIYEWIAEDNAEKTTEADPERHLQDISSVTPDEIFQGVPGETLGRISKRIADKKNI